MSDGRKRSVENLNQQSRKASDEAADRFREKLKALETSIKKRLKNPMDGLPRSIKAFCEWEGEQGVLAGLKTSRSTLNENIHEVLKTDIEAVIASVKNPTVTRDEGAGEYKKLAEQQARQMEGLSEANQQLEYQIEALQEELLVIRAERDRYQKNFEAVKRANKKSSPNGNVVPFL